MKLERFNIFCLICSKKKYITESYVTKEMYTNLIRLNERDPYNTNRKVTYQARRLRNACSTIYPVFKGRVAIKKCNIQLNIIPSKHFFPNFHLFLFKKNIFRESILRFFVVQCITLCKYCRLIKSKSTKGCPIDVVLSRDEYLHTSTFLQLTGDFVVTAFIVSHKIWIFDCRDFRSNNRFLQKTFTADFQSTAGRPFENTDAFCDATNQKKKKDTINNLYFDAIKLFSAYFGVFG